jgi:oxepin-CoA hydrolase/3-oxo-5,6-dehydrosuberyl-CoA semialdehyde dehydrogenase
MIQLRSYVGEEFVTGGGEQAVLVNPATEEPLAQTSTQGVDFARALQHARKAGAASLRALNFASRGALLLLAGKTLHAHRDELIGLAVQNGGNTRGDAKFDIDGAIATLTAYGELGQRLGEINHLRDGEGEQPMRSARLWGEHLWLPRCGVAVHINAFNFPAWGLCEKAAVAWLCGLPVISKPATSSALLAYRIVELWAQAQVLPAGALTFLPGALGNLLELLGEQDVLAFTGSSDTAQLLRRHRAVLEGGVRLNVEADSLNAAILGPDGEEGSEVYDLFLADVLRDITQKAGQKCTAIRRIYVPADRLDAVLAELTDRLAAVRVGNPQDDKVTMGPVATRAQLEAVRRGITRLAESPAITVATGGAEPLAGIAAPSGRGYFVRPTLLACRDAQGASPVDEHEVFGPVATLIPYAHTQEAIAGVRRGGGCLVTSIYSDDRGFVPEVVLGLGPYNGRIFVGGGKLCGQSPGPGTVFAALNHGGPGRAGDGHELGGVRGMQLYMQRCAVMGYKPTVEGLLPGAARAR